MTSYAVNQRKTYFHIEPKRPISRVFAAASVWYDYIAKHFQYVESQIGNSDG